MHSNKKLKSNTRVETSQNKIEIDEYYFFYKLTANHVDCMYVSKVKQ